MSTVKISGGERKRRGGKGRKEENHSSVVYSVHSSSGGTIGSWMVGQKRCQLHLVAGLFL
jgi:hypothetical protein